MSDLENEACTPCEKGTQPLKGEGLTTLLRRLDADWKAVDEHHLEREYRFPNFQEALEFTNRVGALAESVHHHPDIHLAWGKVGITLWTHSIGGLSKSDLVMAAKIEALHRQHSA